MLGEAKKGVEQITAAAQQAATAFGTGAAGGERAVQGRGGTRGGDRGDFVARRRTPEPELRSVRQETTSCPNTTEAALERDAASDPHADNSGSETNDEAAISSTRQFVTFHMEKETFAVPLTEVQEIIRLPAMVEVPMASPSLEGLANLRGSVLPIINLRRIFRHAGRRSRRRHPRRGDEQRQAGRLRRRPHGARRHRRAARDRRHRRDQGDRRHRSARGHHQARARR